MKSFRYLVAVIFAVLIMSASAKADTTNDFDRMFPPALPTPTVTSNQQLADLSNSMLEPAARNNPRGTTGGVTFFGQFIDHDLDRDTSPSPQGPVNPVGLPNERTFAFDLDNVYGTGGPKARPDLYQGDKLRVGVGADGVTPDLPRNPDGSAILGDPRNDENQILSQFHTAILRLHNALIDRGYSFQRAHDTVVNAYRYVVLHDYLPQIVGQSRVDHALSDDIYNPSSTDHPYTPLEFSVAAFRFGHSQVRNAYNINDNSGGVRVFSLDPTVPDLSGGRRLTEGHGIDFDNFFSELPQDGGPLLIGRAIDTQISLSLFQLPIPGAEAEGSNVLAFRNMVRAKFYNLPSYEAVAKAMGETPVGEPRFSDGTPLWYGILREAELTTGGAELGPVGGRIVASVFVHLLNLNAGLKKIDRPDLPDSSGGDFTMGDLLTAAQNFGN